MRQLELVGNALCLDFTNTVNCRPEHQQDLLGRADTASEWAHALGLGAPAPSSRRVVADLVELRRLRENMHEVFAAVAAGDEPPGPALAAIITAYAAALPQAEWRSAGNRLQPTWPTGRRLRDLAGPVAGSAVELLGTGPLDRVSQCPSCGWLFLDTSRNRQRRWCSMATCGGREKAARYQARKAATGSPGRGR